MRTLNGYHKEHIDASKCDSYLRNWAIGLRNRIKKGDPRSLLYKEQAAFLDEAREVVQTNTKNTECVDYLSSWAESLKEEIENGSPLRALYEEQILFLEKTLESIR